MVFATRPPYSRDHHDALLLTVWRSVDFTLVPWDCLISFLLSQVANAICHSLITYQYPSLDSTYLIMYNYLYYTLGKCTIQYVRFLHAESLSFLHYRVCRCV